MRPRVRCTPRFGAAVLASAFAIAGCGGDDEDAADPPNKDVRAADIGESVQLRSDAGEPLRATLVAVQDPVREHQFEDASISGRFVGIELRIVNEGEIRFRGSPWAGSRLSTSKGAERPTRMLTQGSCLRARKRVIAPGASQTACIPFRVGKNARLLKFRYTPAAGFSPAAGVWRLSG